MLTYSLRLLLEESFRILMSLLWQLLIEMLSLFFELTKPLDVVARFLRGEFSLFWGNRINIQGVSTGKATRQFVHHYRRNSHFSFLTRVILTYV